MFWPAPDVKARTFGSSEFPAKMILSLNPRGAEEVRIRHYFFTPITESRRAEWTAINQAIREKQAWESVATICLVTTWLSRCAQLFRLWRHSQWSKPDLITLHFANLKPGIRLPPSTPPPSFSMLLSGIIILTVDVSLNVFFFLFSLSLRIFCDCIYTTLLKSLRLSLYFSFCFIITLQWRSKD